jgi:hypothetical protein
MKERISKDFTMKQHLILILSKSLKTTSSLLMISGSIKIKDSITRRSLRAICHKTQLVYKEVITTTGEEA